MSAVQLDSGCCGEDLKTDRISLLGVFTFCFPLSIAFLVLSPALRLLSRSSVGKALSALARANTRLLTEAPVMPRAKCRTAARLYSVSPWLSGFVFRHFNFLLFLLVTAIAVISGCGALRLIWRS